MPESSTVTGRKVADALRAAGHDVSACHATGDNAYECAALRREGECPLERLPVDLYLLLRTGDSRTERGALCAAARKIPLVVGGAVVDNPYRPWTAAEQPGTDVVGLVEEVGARPLPLHSRVATAALEATLGSSVVSASATVHRVAGGLRAVLAADPTPSQRKRAAAVTRVHQKLRAVDPWARSVDVSFAP